MFGVYGKWLGVNWVWSLYLAIFHGVWRVLTPIAIVEAIYFRVAYKQWIREKELVFSALLFTIDVTIINLLLTKYRPSCIRRLACFATIFALVFTAKKLRFRKTNMAGTYVTPQRYGSYWILWSIAFFTVFYIYC